MAKITGRRESETGANTHYRLGNNQIITRAEGVRRAEAGLMPDYHVIKVNGVKYLRDNPGKSKLDNIDSQPLI